MSFDERTVYGLEAPLSLVASHDIARPGFQSARRGEFVLMNGSSQDSSTEIVLRDLTILGVPLAKLVLQSPTGDTRHLRVDFDRAMTKADAFSFIQRLAEALARTGDLIAPDITLSAIRAEPAHGKDGQNIGEHVAEKYGSSPEQSLANRAMIRDRAAGLGFTIAMSDSSRIYNTFDAHRLLLWAQLEGKQAALRHALFNAYFTDQRDPSDHGVLIGTSAKAGLDPARREEFVFWHSASGSSARFCPIPFNLERGRLRSSAGKRV